MDAQTLEQMRERVFAAYEHQGYARALVGEWAISTNDVADLVSAALATQPAKILEVGTYVGVSTMMLALACPDATIFTVDPNFELSREMRAVGGASDIDETVHRHHTIARRAAEFLGVVARIRFVEGGFSVGDTFTSVLEDMSATTPVVGPGLCAEHGPFDLIFIDGLHTSEAVEKDLLLAAGALSKEGAIVLHDCIGFWGAGVRRGVMAFMRRHPDFGFEHPPFSEVYRSVGRVSRAREGRSFRDPGCQHPDLSRALTAFSRAAFGGASVLEIAVAAPCMNGGPGAIEPLVLSAAEAGAMTTCPRLDRAVRDHPATDLVAVEAADFMSDDVLRQLLQLAANQGRRVFFGATPPGEAGIAGPCSRPLARLVDLAQSVGMSLFLVPFADQEHVRYALLPAPRQLGLTSLLLNLIVAAPGPEFIDSAGRAYVHLTAALAFDIEQEALQRVHLACAYRKYLSLANEEQSKRLTVSDSLLKQFQAAQSRAEDLDAARVKAVREFSEQAKVARDAADAALARVHEVDQARLDAIREYSGQARVAREAAEVERNLRMEAVADLTRQVNEQSTEVARLRALAESLEAERAALASERNVARATAFAAEHAGRTLKGQLIEMFAGLEALENLVREAECLHASAPPAAETATGDAEGGEVVSDAMRRLRGRVEALLRGETRPAGAPATEAAPVHPSPDLDDRIQALEWRNAQLQGEIERIRRSLSWRLLGPWRVARRQIARFIG